MGFGLFTVFSTREGALRFHTFQEWSDSMQVPEDVGLDTLWLDESHFRSQRTVLTPPHQTRHSLCKKSCGRFCCDTRVFTV
jgi:hypothetical protein